MSTEAHEPGLQHHFVDAAQQKSAAKFGMWLFLSQEILFFGGLFMAYIAIRFFYPDTFLEAHEHLSVPMGTFNTFVLITSSLSMALGVRAAQTDDQKKLVIYLVITIALACTFLVVKYFEYSHKLHDCLLPGDFFCHRDAITGLCAQECPVAAQMTGQPHIFFALYFVMTGMHGLHVLIGVGVLVWILIGSIKGKYTSKYHNPVENVGLYWHLVDLIWIFLFPLLYLVK